MIGMECTATLWLGEGWHRQICVVPKRERKLHTKHSKYLMAIYYLITMVQF